MFAAAAELESISKTLKETRESYAKLSLFHFLATLRELF
jgi:hypothetical protein